ncbi:helix-turn-helix domain-containing protein [Colwelliaceae bacterium 6471]
MPLREPFGSFRQSLNRTRLELAISYVCDTTLSLGEISYLLGFSSSSAFQRAFKRWTGAAPGQYREAASANKI